jgi:hypothetical protein
LALGGKKKKKMVMMMKGDQARSCWKALAMWATAASVM